MCRIALSLLLVASFAGVLAVQHDPQVEEIIKSLESKGGVTFHDCKTPDLRKDEIRFHLYTRLRVLHNLTINDISAEDFLEHYNPNKTTKVLIHGWRGFSTMKPFERMVFDYLYMQDVNVISMDWSVYSRKCNLESVARDVTTVCGGALVDLLHHLKSHGSHAKNFHIITFGVGAHIAAVAGKKMHPLLGRITALEPMGLHFDHAEYPKLESADAELVDVIYTTMNHSSHRACGHIIFYPEGGFHPQPECENDSEMASAYKSILYFRRSIVTPYAYPAKMIPEGSFTGPRPEREAVGSTYTPENYMGEYVDLSKPGKYYVNVKGLPLHTPHHYVVV